MSATTRQTHQTAAAEQWVIPVIVAAWIVVLLSGFLVLV
jgi:hypothetical protein